ncbi:GlxA family transcriptional regulator [Sphingomonas tabacisoli]|uniref:GlxA family transcriptional regulator n=1 Tax=Sphingomonas tabacisoli TaxID=2249466 RepID=A0ABW4I257_9SPHN
MTRRVPLTVALQPRTLLLDVAGPMEAVRKANLIQDEVRFDVTYVAATRYVATSIGLTISGLAALPAHLPEQATAVVAGSASSALGIEDEPTGEDGELTDWLAAVVRPDHRLITICSGAIAAGRAGLFDGLQCTTHHDCIAELRAVAPAAKVLENRLFVEDRGRWSSAGITAGIDLMLHLIATEAGHGVAAAVARYLVVYLRREGGDPQLSPWLDGRNHLHRTVHRAQDAVAADPARDWSVAELARAAGASPRNLSRLFNEHTGMSVGTYVARLRVALARELLTQTQLDMERVAERTGFGSSRQLRRAWRRMHDQPPRALRSAGVTFT